jgi:sortase A
MPPPPGAATRGGLPPVAPVEGARPFVARPDPVRTEGAPPPVTDAAPAEASPADRSARAQWDAAPSWEQIVGDDVSRSHPDGAEPAAAGSAGPDAAPDRRRSRLTRLPLGGRDVAGPAEVAGRPADPAPAGEWDRIVAESAERRAADATPTRSDPDPTPDRVIPDSAGRPDSPDDGPATSDPAVPDGAGRRRWPDDGASRWDPRSAEGAGRQGSPEDGAAGWDLMVPDGVGRRASAEDGAAEWDRPAANRAEGRLSEGDRPSAGWDRVVPDRGGRPDGVGEPAQGDGPAGRERPETGRKDVWDRPAAPGIAGETGGAEVARWDTVLPPVSEAQDNQNRTEDRGAAGVDEATTFMSQWGPPPLAVPRPNDQERGGRRDRTRGPSAPSRAGAGGTAANPPEPAPPGAGLTRTPPDAGAGPADAPSDRPAPGAAAAAVFGRPPTRTPADPPTADGTVARPPERRTDAAPATGGAEPAADGAQRWIADRLATDRLAADRLSSGRAATDPADRAADAAANRFGGDVDRGDRFAGDGRTDDASAGGGGRFGGDVDGRDGQRDGWGAVGGRPDVERPQPDEPYQEDPTEVMGPFDIGAWSLQGRDGAAAPDRRRPRGQDTRGQDSRGEDRRGQDGRGQDGRQGARPEPVRQRAADRVLVGVGGGGGGGGGDEPPSGGRGGDGGGDPHRHTTGDRIRTFIRGIGQTFLTLGVVLLLLAGYEVWFTDLVNHRTQHRLTTALEKQWEDGDDPTVATGPAKPGEKIASLPIGDGFALIYMPDFGTDYVYTVVEGTGVNELNEGPGHYVGTPLPGAVGNVAIAGHRVGKGSPFLNLDKLKAGSAIVIRTKSYWYTYRVLGDTSTGNPEAMSSLGVPGREIVDPSDVGVIAPVPDKPGATPTRRMLTLTTCHPKFSARQRMVVHAILDGAPFPVSKGTPPSMTGSGG